MRQKLRNAMLLLLTCGATLFHGGGFLFTARLRPLTVMPIVALASPLQA